MENHFSVLSIRISIVDNPCEYNILSIFNFCTLKFKLTKSIYSISITLKPNLNLFFFLNLVFCLNLSVLIKIKWQRQVFQFSFLTLQKWYCFLYCFNSLFSFNLSIINIVIQFFIKSWNSFFQFFNICKRFLSQFIYHFNDFKFKFTLFFDLFQITTINYKK
jgi:hypothetical protein